MVGVRQRRSRLMRRARGSVRAADPALQREIERAIAELAAAENRAAPYAERLDLEFRKWQAIHKYVHRNPFATDERLARSAQWRAVLDYARDLREPEVLDWVLQQVEIAEHHEHGIRDLRPRKSGPCHPLLLEYVANRKRKALAVLRWAREWEKGHYRPDAETHRKVFDGKRERSL